MSTDAHSISVGKCKWEVIVRYNTYSWARWGCYEEDPEMKLRGQMIIKEVEPSKGVGEVNREEGEAQLRCDFRWALFLAWAWGSSGGQMTLCNLFCLQASGLGFHSQELASSFPGGHHLPWTPFLATSASCLRGSEEGRSGLCWSEVCRKKLGGWHTATVKGIQGI